MLSPGKPLGDAPVPIVPGVDVFGTPGWLTPLVLGPVVLGVVGAIGGGVAGETVDSAPAGGTAWAATARVEPMSDVAASAAIIIRCPMGNSIDCG